MRKNPNLFKENFGFFLFSNLGGEIGGFDAIFLLSKNERKSPEEEEKA